jgi:protease IV
VERDFIMRKRVIIGVIAGLILILLVAAGISKKGPSIEQESFLDAAKKKVALINITGDILASEHTLELLNTFGNMKSVKAIVLRVNSPGGGVGASQEIFRAVRKLHENGKAIIVSMGDAGASGAYYIASAADKIYANPGTITGSIGVIMSFMNAEKLLGKVGVNFETVKSGKYKDTGSFSRPSTPEERALLRGLIEDVLNQFVDDVISCRMDKLAPAFKIKEKDEVKRKKLVKDYMLANVADGRVFTGKEALKLGLIDELGNIDDAIEGAAAMVGIPGRPMVISEKPRRGISAWLDTKLSNLNFKEESGFLLRYILK